MVKLIDTLLDNLPLAEEVNFDKLILKESEEYLADNYFTCNNNVFMIKCSLIADDYRGVDLDITGAVKNLQDYITEKSGSEFHPKGKMDFNLDCPIYETNGEVSHLPTSTLGWFVSNTNSNYVVITPQLYDNTFSHDEDEQYQKYWMWEVLAVKFF